MPNQQQQESIYLLDYGAGNVRSLLNAVNKLGYSIKEIKSVSDFQKADVTFISFLSSLIENHIPWRRQLWGCNAKT
jgi:hypothetical protein